MCLTVPDKTSGDGSKLIVKKCTSDSKPDASQLFVWGLKDSLFQFVSSSIQDHEHELTDVDLCRAGIMPLG